MHRARHLLATHARLGFDIHGWQNLRTVESLDIGDRHRHRLFEFITETIAGSLHLLSGHAKIRQLNLVKACAKIAQSCVAFAFHARQNVTHNLTDAVRGRQRRACQQRLLRLRAARLPVHGCHDFAHRLLQHFFDWQHQNRTGTQRFEFFHGFPEQRFATHHVHCHTAHIARQR